MKISSINDPTPLEQMTDRQFRVVIFENPYQTIQNPITQRLLGKVAAMKIAGYKLEYPDGVLPVDTVDFVGNHILLCEETPSGLDPITGFKSITKERCDYYNIPFPVFGLFRGSSLSNYEAACKKLLEDAANTNTPIAYNSSWSIHPRTRNDLRLRQLGVDLAVALLVHYYREYEIPWILAGASVRFKVDRIKRFFGFEPVSLNGTYLQPFQCAAFFKERVLLMILKSFTQESIEFSRRYSKLWEDRIVIGADTAQSGVRKAA